MKSSTLALYKGWMESAKQEEIDFVDLVYALCEKNYSNGGDTIVECFTPNWIIEQFPLLENVRKFIGLKLEQASNARWGEDDDPELIALENFETNWSQL